MDFGPALVALIAKLDAITIVFLIMLSGCAWWHYVKDKQNREDRIASIESNAKLSDAINGMKQVIAAISGKVV